MELLKKLFTFSFKPQKDVAALVISVVIYVLAGIIGGAIIALASLLTGWIPLIGKLIGIVLGLCGGVIGLYCLVGIVVLLLVYFKVIKD